MFILFGIFLLLCSLGTGILAGRISARAFFPACRPARLGWMLLVIFISVAFFIGFRMRDYPTPVSTALRLGGTAWLITLPYWISVLAAFAIARRLQRHRPFLPAPIQCHILAIKRAACLGVASAVGVILLSGYVKFNNPEITPVEVRVAKSCGARKELRVAIASDLHLGEVIDKTRLAHFVARINALKPNLILLAGDLVDNRVQVLTEQNMREELSQLKAPLGVYAVLGNHDARTHNQCAWYFEQSGIRVLRDEVVPVDGGAFYIAGRRDAAEQNLWQQGKPLAEILRGIDADKPVIVLDHQPRDSRVREAADCGAVLSISGHTHGGQVWPITWLVPFLYKVSYGLGREGRTAVYVTSGLGLWGFPARIGSKSEIVDMRVVFSPP